MGTIDLTFSKAEDDKPPIVEQIHDVFRRLLGTDGFTVDDAEIQRQELAARIELAKEAQAYWITVSPVGDPVVDPHSGEYIESIEVRVQGDHVTVGSTDDKANLIEYGSINNPEYAPRAKVQARFRGKN
jgi:hypothetical protein